MYSWQVKVIEEAGNAIEVKVLKLERKKGENSLKKLPEYAREDNMLMNYTSGGRDSRCVKMSTMECEEFLQTS